MIAETTINLYPIFRLLCFASILVIAIFLIHNGITLLKSLNIFSKHDNSVIEKFLNKYPDVAPAFMTKGIKEQNIENNQEIHEINKRFDKQDKEIEELKKVVNQLTEILERLQNGK